MRTIVWFRDKDLRVADHEPLYRANDGGEVIPLFVLDPAIAGPERAREAPHRTQFLLESLGALKGSLQRRGSDLVVVRGSEIDAVPELARRWKADRIWAHHRTLPSARSRAARIARSVGCEFRFFSGETLVDPGSILTVSRKPYAVFTPFKNAFLREASIRKPRPAPGRIRPLPSGVADAGAAIPSVLDFAFQKNAGLLKGGESAGRSRLQAFLSGPARNYAAHRDRMDLEGTSRLSADLATGTLSVREVWHRVTEKLWDSAAGRVFRSQLIWREFGYDLAWHRPEVLEKPFRLEFEDFPWKFDARYWEAWIEGRTGFPIVDAAARQLVHEGFVHNRARMVAASFLTKHLGIDYRLGEAHYIKYLTDGDPPQNNMGWQWSAGCGSDAQPYFRVFNPILQGRRFDPYGDYVRRWVPELASVPPRHIHSPWTAPERVLDDAGVRLGRDYPYPIVDHAEARERFLALARRHLRGRRVSA